MYNSFMMGSLANLTPGGDPDPDPDPTFFLDDYSQALLHFSFRKMRTGQTVCYRISRDDLDELDLGFDPVTGSVDMAAALDFCGSGGGSIVNWYGAGMGGYVATQNTKSQQPLVVISGAYVTRNGKPSAYYNGSTMHMNIADDVSLRQTRDYSLFAVAEKSDTSSGTFFAKSSGTSSGNSMYVLDSANAALRFVAWEAAGTARVCSASGRRADVLELHEGHHIPGSPAVLQRWRDGELLATTNTTDPLFSNSVPLQIGVRGTTARYAGYISEIQIANTHTTTFNEAYRSNVADYYSITMV